jgi:MT-A70
VTILTWAKDSMTTGDWLRGQTEHCIMAVRGKPVVTLTNQTTLLHARRRGHSVKPVEFYDFVENLCPAPRYCYLFSRYRHNSKWDFGQIHAGPYPSSRHPEQEEKRWLLTRSRLRKRRRRLRHQSQQHFMSILK